MRKGVLLFICFVIVFGSCKKDEPQKQNSNNNGGGATISTANISLFINSSPSSGLPGGTYKLYMNGVYKGELPYTNNCSNAMATGTSIQVVLNGLVINQNYPIEVYHVEYTPAPVDVLVSSFNLKLLNGSSGTVVSVIKDDTYSQTPLCYPANNNMVYFAFDGNFLN